MVEVKCPHCGTVQKADENKYEVPCKKCKEPFNVEEGIDLLISGREAAPKIAVEETDFDTLLARGLDCLDNESYAGARAFLEKALEVRPDDAQALWAMCRTVMCAPPLEVDPDCLRYLDGDTAVCAEYAAREGCTEARAEFELRKKLRASACFTDDESDDYFERAREAAEPEMRKRIEQEYALYSYCPAENAADADRSEIMSGAFRDVPPNFGATKPVIGWKLMLATVLSVLATVGAIVLLALDFQNGWVIALLVLGLVASLFCSVGILVDNKRQLIRKILAKYYVTEVEELAQALFRCTSPEELENATDRCATLIGSMIYGGQLTFIGLREGRFIDYYDSACNLIPPEEKAADAEDPFRPDAADCGQTADATREIADAADDANGDSAEKSE